ncbi:MAG: hypothetical protein JXJ19_06630 [Elusimicrobia bacterium]|nr:hypothetical protein [Elusimicrobiota bacterium]
MRYLGPGQRAGLLAVLVRIVSLGMKIPQVHEAYHRFRKHGDLPARRFIPLYRSQNPDTAGEDIVLLFSGGKDSTYAAWLLSFYFRKVHLLTMRLFSISEFKRCEINVRRLKDARGESKFSHQYADGNALFDDLHFKQMKLNRRLFGGTVEGAACISCHLAAQTRAVIFCKKKGVRWIALGFSPLSHRSFEQGLSAAKMIERFFFRYGIYLSLPLLERPYADAVEELFNNRVIPHRKLGKPYQFGMKNSTQGSCPFGMWTNINFTCHEFSRGFDDYINTAARFRAHLENQCEKYLRECCNILPENVLPENAGQADISSE